MTIPPWRSLCFLFADPFLFLSAPWGRRRTTNQPKRKTLTKCWGSSGRNPRLPFAPGFRCSPSSSSSPSSEALESLSRSAVGRSQQFSVGRHHHLSFFSIKSLSLLVPRRCSAVAQRDRHELCVVVLECWLCFVHCTSARRISRLCLPLALLLLIPMALVSCFSVSLLLFASRVVVSSVVRCVRVSDCVPLPRSTGVMLWSVYSSCPSRVSTSTRAFAPFCPSQQIQKLHLSRQGREQPRGDHQGEGMRVFKLECTTCRVWESGESRALAAVKWRLLVVARDVPWGWLRSDPLSLSAVTAVNKGSSLSASSASLLLSSLLGYGERSLLR